MASTERKLSDTLPNEEMDTREYIRLSTDLFSLELGYVTKGCTILDYHKADIAVAKSLALFMRNQDRDVRKRYLERIVCQGSHSLKVLHIC
jgi:hypothetical protein